VTVHLTKDEMRAVVEALEGNVGCLRVLVPLYPPGPQVTGLGANLRAAESALAKIKKARPGEKTVLEETK
jgi:hypothetical protein